LQELLKGDSVLCCLSSGDTDAVRFQGFANGRVTEDVIGVGWFCHGYLTESLAGERKVRQTFNEDWLVLD
jgi:hypothetical protein